MTEQPRRAQPQRFTVALLAGGRGRAYLRVPFDPDKAWAPKPRHPVTGSVNGHGVRGVLETGDGGWGFTLGPAWLRDCGGVGVGVGVGDTVEVELRPEGPQRDDLDPDVAAALLASPRAGEFFDALAQFYRKAYLKWIDGAKRRPQERAARLAELVGLLEAGVKQRPKT